MIQELLINIQESSILINSWLDPENYQVDGVLYQRGIPVSLA